MGHVCGIHIDRWERSGKRNVRPEVESLRPLKPRPSGLCLVSVGTTIQRIAVSGRIRDLQRGLCSLK